MCDTDDLPASTAPQPGADALPMSSSNTPAAQSCVQDDCHPSSSDIGQGQQLKAMQKQLILKQQEVELLQAQVQRLCNYVDATVGNSAQEAASDGGKVQHWDCSSLYMQLGSTAQDLIQTREQLTSALEAAQKAQSLLATTSAAKASLQKRNGSLRLLLAEHIRDNVLLIQGLDLCQEGLQAAYTQLQEAQQNKAASEAEIASKVRHCQALQDALDAANAHIVQLQERQEYEQQIQQPIPQVQLSGRVNSCSCCQSSPVSTENAELEQQVCRQQLELDRQKLELNKQRQELEVAAEQLQALTRLLAIKEDSLAYAERHSMSLEKQLEAVNQQLLDSQSHQQAPGVSQSVYRTSCSLVDAAVSTEGLPNLAVQRQQEQQQSQQPQQQLCEAGVDISVDITRTSSAGFLDGLAAAISKKFSSDMKDSHGVSPELASGAGSAGSKQCEQPSPLGPFARARSLMAQREENLVAQIKEELRDKEKQIKELTAAATRIEGQLHGLQTVLTAKTCACNRLEGEISKVERQLKQVQAAAVADAEGYKQQLGVLSERVLHLEELLSASEHREQQLQVESAAVRTKLSQVLAAVVQETDCLMQHKPLHVVQLKDDMTAALADVDPCGSAAAAAVQAALASSSAAALAILGGPWGAAAGGAVVSGKESLGNRLMGVLLGRKSSTSIGDMLTPNGTDRVLGDSNGVDGNGRILYQASHDGPGVMTPRVQAACSETVTPILRHAGSGTERRGLSISRKPSDTAATCELQSAQENNHVAIESCSSTAEECLKLQAEFSVNQGAGVQGSNSTRLQATVVREKLKAVNELVCKLGLQGAETTACEPCGVLHDTLACSTSTDTRT